MEINNTTTAGVGWWSRWLIEWSWFVVWLKLVDWLCLSILVKLVEWSWFHVSIRISIKPKPVPVHKIVLWNPWLMSAQAQRSRRTHCFSRVTWRVNRTWDVQSMLLSILVKLIDSLDVLATYLVWSAVGDSVHNNVLRYHPFNNIE